MTSHGEPDLSTRVAQVRSGLSSVSGTLRNVPAAVLLVDTATRAVTYANPVARAMVPAEVTLPVAAAEWSDCAGLRYRDGTVLPGLESPVAAAARGLAVHGDAVRVPHRRLATLDSEETAVAEGVDAPERTEERVLWVTAVPLPESAGLVDRALVVFLEVDPEFPDDLSEDLHLQALRSTELSFTIADPRQPDCPLVWVNESFQRVTGYAPEEVLGRNCRLLQGPDTDRSAIGELSAAQVERRSTTVILLNYRRDGTTFWSEVSLSPIIDAQGELTHYVGVQVDVSARLRSDAERARLLAQEQAARAAAEAAHNRLALLAEATSVLAETLDVQPALQRLTEVLVPALGDACIVDLWSEGVVQRVAVSHVDKEKAGLVWQLTAEDPIDPQGDAAIPSILRGAPSVLHPEVEPDFVLATRTPTPEQQRLRGLLPVRSAMVVPLAARSRVLGTLSLLTQPGGRRLGEPDRQLAEDLTRRAALVIDNARLYNREHATALALQRSLLPSIGSRFEGLEVGARYQSGTEGAEVGGDWYDVVPLGGDRTALVIGDVMGRGLHAAAVMGQLRAAIRAFAQLDLPAEDVLELLDRLVGHIDDAQFVTATYAVYDPADGVLRYANAGHPPLVLAHADGTAESLDQASGPALGLEIGPYGCAGVALRPGDLVCFYTDGLVERRDADLDDQLGHLQDTVAALAASGVGPEDACDKLLERMLPEGRVDDDAALLVLRVPPLEAAARLAQVDVEGSERAASAGRRWTRTVLEEWQVDESLADDALSVVGELLANAVVHGSSPVSMRLRLTRRRLLVEVRDAQSALPRRQPLSADAEHGRGLHMVAVLAASWGVRPLEGRGKAVWAALDREPGAAG